MGGFGKEFVVRLRIASNKTVQHGADAQQNNFFTERLKSDVLNQFLWELLLIKPKVMSSNPETLQDAIEIAKREERIEL